MGMFGVSIHVFFTCVCSCLSRPYRIPGLFTRIFSSASTRTTVVFDRAMKYSTTWHRCVHVHVYACVYGHLLKLSVGSRISASLFNRLQPSHVSLMPVNGLSTGIRSQSTSTGPAQGLLTCMAGLGLRARHHLVTPVPGGRMLSFSKRKI